MVRTLVSPKARAAARALSATAVFTSPFNPGHVVVVVPVPLETTAGGIQFSSASYSLTLHGLISRSEFDCIVAALNAACERCRLNATAVHMLPAALLAPLLASKLARLRSELTAVCRELSKEHSSRCINLRVVDEPSCDDNECGILCFTLARMSPFRVNLEVMTTV